MKKKDEMNIVFMGTPEFAVAGLEKLIEEDYNVKAVITAPDRPAGRGRKLNESAVKKYAIDNHINVLQPFNLKDEHFIAELKEYQADLFIVVAFRMLPKAVWELPSLGTFNLHGSLLPQYRGAAPINWAIINGETMTGVTTFFIDEKIDTGQIILNKEMAIGKEETAGELHDRMMSIGAELIIDTVELIRKGKASPQPQPNHSVKKAPKINKQDGLLDFNLPIEKIHNLIRGLSPYPTAWIKLKQKQQGQEKKLKIFRSKIINEDKNNKVAIKAIGASFFLETCYGTLALTEVQMEGKKKLDAPSFLTGFRPEEWEVLSHSSTVG